jgi:hypothetical protein
MEHFEVWLKKEYLNRHCPYCYCDTNCQLLCLKRLLQDAMDHVFTDENVNHRKVLRKKEIERWDEKVAANWHCNRWMSQPPWQQIKILDTVEEMLENTQYIAEVLIASLEKMYDTDFGCSYMFESFEREVLRFISSVWSCINQDSIGSLHGSLLRIKQRWIDVMYYYTRLWA